MRLLRERRRERLGQDWKIAFSRSAVSDRLVKEERKIPISRSISVMFMPACPLICTGHRSTLLLLIPCLHQVLFVTVSARDQEGWKCTSSRGGKIRYKRRLRPAKIKTWSTRISFCEGGPDTIVVNHDYSVPARCGQFHCRRLHPPPFQVERITLQAHLPGVGPLFHRFCVAVVCVPVAHDRVSADVSGYDVLYEIVSQKKWPDIILKNFFGVALFNTDPNKKLFFKKN